MWRFLVGTVCGISLQRHYGSEIDMAVDRFHTVLHAYLKKPPSSSW